MYALLFRAAAAAALACSLALHPTCARAEFGDCGQPVSSGTKPSAADALAILKFAVAGEGVCEIFPCICDANYESGDVEVTAADALLVLRAAVGQHVELTCCPE